MHSLRQEEHDGTLTICRVVTKGVRAVKLLQGGTIRIALVVWVGFACAGCAGGAAPSVPSPVVSPSPSTEPTERLSPAATRLGLGQFQPILDVAEPEISPGSAAMHERLGSASDGVIFIKDYGSAPDGGDNIYHVTLYRSFDGVVWRSMSVPTPSDQQDSNVACRGWNCVVVSEFPQNGSVLVTGDGDSWGEVQPSPNLFETSITAGPNGFVMSGYALKTSKPRIVFSPSGRDWQDISFQAGSQPLETGLAFSDSAAGWFLMGGYGTPGNSDQAMALSTDGLMWRDVEDPDHLYATQDMSGQTVFHFKDRWYVLAKYRQMPAGWSAGGMGMPASTSTPVATWQTIYWIQDGSSILHSTGRIFTVLPDEVVVMDGYLAGAKANADFTSSLLLSTDAADWTDQGLLPPGAPEPSYLHGIPVYPIPPLGRAGSNVVMEGDALKPHEMGVGLYVAKPLQ
jgi:hypothetical protein